MKRVRRYIVVAYTASCLVTAVPVGARTLKCPADSVVSGPICIDKYEASVWQIPPSNTSLVKKVLAGKATLADLTTGGAIQRGVTGADYGAACPSSAQFCTGQYAVSIPGVTPSAYITWFQAAAACRNAGKRLATNQEWQVAAFGTRDVGAVDNGTTDCNVSTNTVVPTGSRTSCVSDVGAFDMSGNLYEWVADWVPLSAACPGWGAFSSDEMCLSGAATNGVFGPGALIRGGGFFVGALAGVFGVHGGYVPWNFSNFIGFRCAR
jgi:hypothetical protein